MPNTSAGATFEEFPIGKTTVFNGRNVGDYRLKALTQDGQQRYSNTVELEHHRDRVWPSHGEDGWWLHSRSGQTDLQVRNGNKSNGEMA